MSVYQLADRHGAEHLAAKVAGKDVRQADTLSVQAISRDGINAILKMLGGGMEDSATMEIVNPATGHFWHQNGISAAGGTDDPRP